MKHYTPLSTLAESRRCRLCSPSLGKPWAAALTRQYRSVWWASSTMTVHRSVVPHIIGCPSFPNKLMTDVCFISVGQYRTSIIR